MAIINIGENTFRDHSSVIKNLYESPEQFDVEKIFKEIEERKKNLKEGSAERNAVEKIERDCKKRNWDAVFKGLVSLSAQFSTAALANLVGGYLCSLFGFN